MTASVPVVECRGDPRAMGASQGVHCRARIRDALAGQGIPRRGRLSFSLRPLVGGAVLGRGMGREIVRHYPHQGERIQGLARGATASLDSVMDLVVRTCRGDGPPAACAEAGIAARAGTAPLVARSLPEGAWIARRSEPDVGFASVEITLPWLPSAVGGVNAAGVAAAAVSHPGARPSDAPSALLLVQECLQRFDDVTGCVDWALGRPSSGRFRLLVADAAGRAAAVDLDETGGSVHEVRGETDGKLDADLVLDPKRRRLRWRRPGGPDAILSL